MRKSFVSTLLFFVIFLCALESKALDVQHFRPNFDQQGGVVVQNTKTLPRLNWKPGATINWVLNPIEFGLPNDSRTDTLVGWFTTVDLMLAVGITDDLTLGFDMPFNLGSNIEAVGQTIQAASSNIGDLNLYGKYRLRKQADDHKVIPAIAIIPFVTVPTGDDSVFFGNNSMTGGFKLAMDWALSDRQSLSFNVGPRFREKATILNLTVGNEILGGLGYNRLIWKKQKLHLSVELFGSTTVSKFLSEEISSPAELVVGLHKPWMKDRLQTTFGLGRGGTNGYGAPDVRIFMGASYLFSAPKPKNDLIVEPIHEEAIVEHVDQPSKLPNEEKSRVTIEGSKLILLDKVYFATNKDVILEKSNDILNQVVSTLKAHPEITFVKIEGHTDSLGSDAFNMDLSKRRANRVREYLIHQGIAAERLEANGYGETIPVDDNLTPQGRDNNRRVEFTITSQTSSVQPAKPKIEKVLVEKTIEKPAIEKVPPKVTIEKTIEKLIVKETVETPLVQSVKPEVQVRKEIPVVDTPNQETLLSEKIVDEKIEELNNLVSGRVYFTSEKSNIRQEFKPFLDKIAQNIKLKLKKNIIVIEGHTDSKGEKNYNLRLSEKRANSVKKYLIKSGVPLENLMINGYGETVPVDTNTTIQGRKNNRRVEFLLQSE